MLRQKYRFGYENGKMNWKMFNKSFLIEIKLVVENGWRYIDCLRFVDIEKHN